MTKFQTELLEYIMSYAVKHNISFEEAKRIIYNKSVKIVESV